MRALFPYLGNGWTDCADILYVVRDQLAGQLTQAKGGVVISAGAQSRSSREYSSEILCNVRPINYESYTAMSKVYLRIRKCNCTYFYAYPFTTARSSPERRLTGLMGVILPLDSVGLDKMCLYFNIW